ncbi:hypothetical protein AcW1_008663 [Taiwanofungus camphoratus]|nr:hypothetical protein AcV5_006685 [Antrodia cinnamomea]KAI0929822.1 hypothetical protein AcV5_006685 [Antrodia cinnamomea]KAI0935413.1 hypothetical protein AcV7_010381 [Antrodia cinnamomea]KAI0935414.1 hypothetical protein AcV7_010381 [Antrodia cinnamomea]KAI0948923.1 hypothetical protein AcW1_008663 [Antrodia cinnamomea]
MNGFGQLLWRDNHIRLCPDKHVFAVAMFHELHCLRNMCIALKVGPGGLSDTQMGHMHHYFNYLRQWILCSADVTLEPRDFTIQNFTTERVGATHTCCDREPVYSAVEANWHEWERFRDEHGLHVETR